MRFDTSKLLLSLLALGVGIVPTQGAPIDNLDVVKRIKLPGSPKPPTTPHVPPPVPHVPTVPRPPHTPNTNRKQPVDFEKTAYRAKFNEDFNAYTIKNKRMKDDDEEYVDLLGYDKNKDELVVYDAQNANDKMGSADKLSFNDIQMNFLKHVGKNPDDVKSVRYQDVQNDDAAPKIEQARKELKKNEFTVKATDTGKEKGFFDSLSTSSKNPSNGGNGLTGSLQSAIRDYGMKKKITKIQVSLDEDDLTHMVAVLE